jgi:hypothetical protein
MSDASQTINLKKLDYSPMVNPLLEPQGITVKRRYVRTGSSKELIDASTGEVNHVAAIHEVIEKDDAEFVKVFAAGVAATYDLTKTGQRVFQCVLDEYQRTPMHGGYADSIELFWFGDGLAGRDAGMSEKTFQRGLKELLGKQFLAPRSPSSFWVNPALFFKGDRVMFIKEYRRKRSAADVAKRTELENQGQQKLAI